MITLFDPNETDFTHNGLGTLDKNIINSVVEEDLNGIFSLSFEYPIFALHGLEIDGQSIIRSPVPDGPDQLFRVYKPTKSMGYLKVECYHVFYDLIDNFIEDTNIVSKDGQTALAQMGSKTQYGHNFRFFSDITTIAGSRVVRKNPIEFLLDYSLENSFVNRWGGELKRNNFDVSMYNSIGSDKGVTIRHKKDLLGYEAVVDWHSPVTRIMPIGFDGLLLPEKYIDSPVINSYVKPKIQKIEYGDVKAAIGQYADDKEAVPLEQAYTELRRLAKLEYSKGKIDYPKASYKVEFVTLSKTEEYKDYISLETVALGDTVTVIHSEDNLDIKAKVIKYRFDPLVKKYIDIELGNFKETFSDTQSKIDSIYNHVEEVKQDISLTIQVSADGKNTIYRGVATPVNARVGDMWYKPIDNGNTEMYIYTDDPIVPWQLIFSTASLDEVSKEVDAVIADMAIEKERINQTITKADQAIADAGFVKLDFVQVKQDAVNAMTEAQQATGNVNTISTKVDTLTQTMILKADNTTVNNLTGVVDRHTLDIATNAREISLKLTSAQVDSLVTGKGYATTTALNATSTSLSASIIEVSTDLKNLEIGGRNLVLNSDKGAENSSYVLTTFALTKNVEIIAGEDYTITLKGVANSPLTGFYVNINGGTADYPGLVTLNSSHLIAPNIYRGTFKMPILAKYDSINAYGSPLGLGAFSKLYWVKLEKGNKATDWSPAPEDMATVERAVQIEANLNGLLTTVSNKADKTQITQLAGQISTKVESATYNSKMTQLDSEINLRVTAGQVNESILFDKKVKDTRNTNQTPAWYQSNYPAQIVEEFKYSNVVGIPNATATFGLLTTKIMYADDSGGNFTQVFSSADGVFTRDGRFTTWTSWTRTAEVEKLVAQINLSPKGVLIQGKNIQLDGDVAMDNAFVNRIKAIEVIADKITTGTLNASNLKVIGLDAGSITSGTLNSINITGTKITNNFSVSSEGATLNGATVIAGDYRMDYTVKETGQKGKMVINPISLYSQIFTSSGSLLSSWEISSAGLQVSNSGLTAFYTKDGIYFEAGGQASVKYHKGNARIEIGSYNGVGLGAFAGGSYQNRITVGGGNDSLGPFVDIWSPLTVREGMNMSGKEMYNAFTISGANNILFNKSSNRIVQGSDGFLNILSPMQLSLGWTDGNSSFTTMIITKNQIVAKKNLNMDGNQMVGVSDSRLKTAIDPTVIDSLSAISRWKFVDFNWRYDDKPKGRQFGLIAQDTPELALYDAKNDEYTISASKQIMMTSHGLSQLNNKVVGITALIYSSNATANQALSEIQILRKEIQDLRQKIDKLESAA